MCFLIFDRKENEFSRGITSTSLRLHADNAAGKNVNIPKNFVNMQATPQQQNFFSHNYLAKSGYPDILSHRSLRAWTREQWQHSSFLALLA
jgi:hypothetical protein